MRASVLTGGLVVLAVALLFLPALSREGGALEGAVEPAPVAPADLSARSPWPDRVVRRGWLARVAPLAGESRWAELRAALDRLAPGEGEGRERVERDLLEGLASLRSARAEDALVPLEEAARRARAEAHPLEAEAASLLAEAAGRNGDAALRLRALERSAELRPLDLGLRAELVEALGRAGREPEALALVRASAPQGRGRVVLLGAAVGLGGVPADERAAWLAELGWSHPASSEALASAAEPAWRAALGEALAAGEWGRVLDRLEALVTADKAKVAQSEIRLLLKAGPPPSVRDRAHQLDGRAWRVRKQNSKALAALKKVGEEDAVVSTRARYVAALAARSLRRKGDHVRYLEAAAKGPACEWRDRAVERLADRDVKANRRVAARKRWALLALEGVTEARRADSAWKRAWSYFEDGQADAALAAFTELAATHPRRHEAAASLYWSARILRVGGAPAEARKRLARLADEHPFDYYGLLASDELGRRPPRPGAAGPGEVEAALASLLDELSARDARAAAAIAAQWRAGLVGRSLADLVDASALPGAGERDEQERWVLRIALLGQMGQHRQALREFRRVLPEWRTRRDLPALAWSGAYPRAYSGLVERESTEAGVDAALVFALIHQESVFDARAVSSAGARGLMQIMPGTNRTIARWFRERARTADLVEPDHNVRYGAAYLAHLLEDLEHPELALAGYNAGGTRARRWWKGLPDADLPLFVESIPFDETRHYVKSVTWNRHFYRAEVPAAAADESASP